MVPRGQALLVGMAQVHEALKRSDALCRIPVVLLTADAHAREKAEAMGTAGYLRKPICIGDLLVAIQRHGR